MSAAAGVDAPAGDGGGAAPPLAAAATPRTRLRRHPERALEGAALAPILGAAPVAHVGVVESDGTPVVLPVVFQHEDGVVYLHGSPASRLLRRAASGAPVCVTVTLLDGLVASRDAFNHSANFRSVVLFGHGEPVDDPARKRAVLERMTARLFAGRTAARDYLPARAEQLRATLMVAVRIEEASGKSRSGPPSGPHDGDPHPAAVAHWCGVLPVCPGGHGAGAGMPAAGDRGC